MRADWVECKIGSVTNIFPGIGFPKNIQGKKKGEFPFYKVGDISKNFLNNSRILKECENYVDSIDITNIASKLVPKGTVVFAKIGEGLKLNRRGVTFQNSLIDNNTIGLKAINRIIIDTYLFHFFNTIRLEKYSQATTVPSVRKGDIENILIPLPPLPEQRAIVKKIEALFSSLDAGIADLKKAQDQLKIYRQAVLKKAFEGELTKEWREKQIGLPTAEELLVQIEVQRQSYYEKQIEDWKGAVAIWEKNGKEGKKPEKPTKNQIEIVAGKTMSSGFFVKFGSICNIVRGGSPRPAGDDKFYNGDIPFLKVADLTRINTKFVTEYSYTIKKAGLQKTRFLKKGTLVLSNSGATLGVARILGIDATANDGIAAFLDLLPDLVDFYYFYLNSKTLEFRAIDQGAGQPNLNTDLLKEFQVPVFSKSEQAQIVKEIESRLSVCDAVEQQIKDSLSQAEALRQSILKKAFEGKLLTEEEVKACKMEADYEPAAVLLEKIKAEKKANKIRKKK